LPKILKKQQKNGLEILEITKENSADTLFMVLILKGFTHAKKIFLFI